MKTKFKVTIEARMYHGILYETMKRFGMNQVTLAEYLGISCGTVGNILRMGHVPKFATEPGKQLKQKLEELTEMTVEELFPTHVYTKDFLKKDKMVQITKEVPIHLLSNASQIRQLTLAPDEEIMKREQQEGLEFALSTLTEREIMVLHEHFVNNNTFEKIAIKFGVTSDRIKQINDKALRSLRGSVRMRLLRGEIDTASPFFRTWIKNLSDYRQTHHMR